MKVLTSAIVLKSLNEVPADSRATATNSQLFPISASLTLSFLEMDSLDVLVTSFKCRKLTQSQSYFPTQEKKHE
jgi:hypothetical protein